MNATLLILRSARPMSLDGRLLPGFHFQFVPHSRPFAWAASLLTFWAPIIACESYKLNSTGDVAYPSLAPLAGVWLSLGPSRLFTLYFVPFWRPLMVFRTSSGMPIWLSSLHNNSLFVRDTLSLCFEVLPLVDMRFSPCCIRSVSSSVLNMSCGKLVVDWPLRNLFFFSIHCSYWFNPVSKSGREDSCNQPAGEWEQADASVIIYVFPRTFPFVQRLNPYFFHFLWPALRVPDQHLQ